MKCCGADSILSCYCVLWTFQTVSIVLPIQLVKASLHNHLLITFTEQWFLKFHIMTKGNQVNHLPKSLQTVVNGLT